MTWLALAIVAIAFLPACFGEWWLTVVLIIALACWADASRAQGHGR